MSNIRQLTIKIDDSLGGWVDIDSKELGILYSQTPTMHGLQCNFNEDTEEYKFVQEKVLKIADLVRELDEFMKSHPVDAKEG